MKKITIERYAAVDVPEGAPADLVQVPDFCAGLVEGERDDGSTWIMFLDENGSPLVFWAQREDGAVVGDGIPLQ